MIFVIKMDIKQNIGFRVKELRYQKNLSQKDLSFLSNLDRSYIAGIESGKRNLSIESLEKITKALEISIFDFFNTNQFK